MRERVLGRYSWAGALREDIVRLDAALSTALREREITLADENHPALLHAARTALILLDDAAVHDAVVLCAALLLDSRRVPAVLAMSADAEATALATAVPVPASAGEYLLEQLLAAPTEVRLLACAERLDHARHIHMEAAAELPQWIEEARSTYVPVARRTNPLIARRYEHWADARERRARA